MHTYICLCPVSAEYELTKVALGIDLDFFRDSLHQWHPEETPELAHNLFKKFLPVQNIHEEFMQKDKNAKTSHNEAVTWASEHLRV